MMSAMTAKWRYDDDRTYHGFYDHASERGSESLAWMFNENPHSS